MMKGYTVRPRHKRGGKHGSLVVHPSATIGGGCDLDTSESILVGEGAVLSWEVMVLTHDHFSGGHRKVVWSPLAIEAGVFIGARAIILESCNVIGKGSVIGAGAVVTKDIPAGQVWAGNPARKIGDTGL